MRQSKVKNPRIVIKYCGNCNPAIKVVEVVKSITDRLPGAIILPDDHPERDLTLLVSGCRRDCVTRSESDGETVIVAGNSVDNEEYEISELAFEAVKKIKQKLKIT